MCRYQQVFLDTFNITVSLVKNDKFLVDSCFWCFSSSPLKFAIPPSQFGKQQKMSRVRYTHRHISLHNISIRVKPLTIINKPLRAYSAPPSQPFTDNSFPFKHCIIYDESPIRYIVSYKLPPPYGKEDPQIRKISPLFHSSRRCFFF